MASKNVSLSSLWRMVNEVGCQKLYILYFCTDNTKWTVLGIPVDQVISMKSDIYSGPCLFARKRRQTLLTVHPYIHPSIRIYREVQYSSPNPVLNWALRHHKFNPALPNFIIIKFSLALIFSDLDSVVVNWKFALYIFGFARQKYDCFGLSMKLQDLYRSMVLETHFVFCEEPLS